MFECKYPWPWYLASAVLLVVGAWMASDFIGHLGSRDWRESMVCGLMCLILATSTATFLWSPARLTVAQDKVMGRYLVRKPRVWALNELVVEDRRGVVFAIIGAQAVKNRRGRTQFFVWPGLRNLKELTERLH
jgi:hypothetical protein